MAEKDPEKDTSKKFSPRHGAVEMLQVGSVLLIPAAVWLLRSNRPWLASAASCLAFVFFAWPFYLMMTEVKEAEAEEAKAEILRGVEAKEPTSGVEVPPYHSSREGTKVYHIFSDCNEGNNIEKRYWRKGMGNKTLCESCEEMKRDKERREKPAA